MKKLKKLPEHIGFIIDGNGRWAKNKGKTRSMGHKAGFKNLERIVKECFYKYNISTVSIYAFSTENWNRPKKEVDYLMKIFDQMLDESFAEKYPDIKLNLMGDYSKLPGEIPAKVERVMRETRDNKYTLNLGVNYSGREELVYAINQIIEEGIDKVDTSIIEDHLYTRGQKPLDFLVRTSGEIRLSNFMLWQVAYAEMHFPKVHWPAFSKTDLYDALLEFQSRDRRFGAIKE